MSGILATCVLPLRPTMIKYGISNIRELVGHKVNLEMVYNNPICRI
jgi:phenylalanyl-tRNA synthetase alpha chain